MQKAGLESNDDYTSPDPTTDEDTDSTEKTKAQRYVPNLGKYHCTSRNHHGDLCLSSEDVKFVSAIRKNVIWEVRFDELRLLQKVGTGDGKGLLFVSMNANGNEDEDQDGEEEMRVSGLDRRDEVFSQVVGYSGCRWQVSG
ncbi:MAG: hypothetical protein Q9168_008418 [Polycauliona sp. 1 TL-2023]